MTIFQRPKGVRPTDMAIWIDENAYKDNCDDNKLYMYLCFLIEMLAKVNKYFYNEKDCEDFSTQFATQMFYRYKNPKQFTPDENGEYKLTKIKSVLNYLKSKIFFKMLEYKNGKFSEFNVLDQLDEDSSDSLIDTAAQLNALDSYSLKFRDIEFTDYLDNICKVVYQVLRNIPYKSDIILWRNIYLSCILTFLDQITICEKDIPKLDKVSTYKNDYYLNKLYKEQQNNDAILYHLDETFNQYIKVQVNKIKRKVALELSDIIKSYQPQNEMVKTLLFKQVIDKDEEE